MGWLRELRRRWLLRTRSIDDALWARAKRRLPFLRGLSAEEERRLRGLVLLFLAEKEFAPVGGVRLSALDRLEIAAQACLLVLGLGLEPYDDWVGIVVHPSDFRVRRSETDEAGVVHEWDDELAGESWPGGPVVLSWEALDESGSVPEGGANVVIHEFAHKLDMMDGEADGVPPLVGAAARAAWREVLGREYERFCRALDSGRATLLDPYAAEDESEFFAVASEAFFESPNALRRTYPELYELLRRYYRQDPAARLET